ANHLALGAEFGDREAVAWLRRAARELTSRAPAMAVQLLERAASLLPPADPERASLLRQEIRTLMLVGRARDAEALAEHASMQTTDPGDALQLSVAQVQLLILQSRNQEAAQLAERILATPSLPDEARAELAATSAVARVVMGDVDKTLTVLDELDPFIDANPISLPAAWSTITRGYVAWARGFLEQGVELVEAGVAASAYSPHRVAQALLYLGAFQLRVERFDEAKATLDRARQQLEHLGYVSLLQEYHWYLALLHFLAGRWDDALAETTTSRQLTEETGASGVRSAVGGDPTPLIHLHRGDVPAACDGLDRIETDPGLQESAAARASWIDPTRALIQEARGDPEAALSTLEAWRDSVLGMTFLPDYRGCCRTLVRISRAQGREEWLERIVEEADEAARRAGPVPSVQGTALLLRGMVDNDPEALLAAVDAFRASPRLFDRAEACAEAGVSLLSRASDAEGRALLAEAFDLYGEMGAQRAEAALAAELRSFGIHRGARGRRQRPVSGWQALTATESRIVALVAEGLTNGEIGDRLYISRGTVATHLRSVFRKLDVSSRAELAAGAARHLT
ncbi:MAG: LuxR C-terminal-related transcriptional regulator, partial [Acidimicrobiia bacterium]